MNWTSYSFMARIRLRTRLARMTSGRIPRMIASRFFMVFTFRTQSPGSRTGTRPPVQWFVSPLPLRERGEELGGLLARPWRQRRESRIESPIFRKPRGDGSIVSIELPSHLLLAYRGQNLDVRMQCHHRLTQ